MSVPCKFKDQIGYLSFRLRMEWRETLVARIRKKTADIFWGGLETMDVSQSAEPKTNLYLWCPWCVALVGPKKLTTVKIKYRFSY